MASSAAGYIWEDPGDSIMIQVSLDLVERLGAAIKQGLGTGPRGMEIGGLLLGRMLPGFGRAILIEDFEPAPCEHFRGASYTLSPKDQRLLGTRLARRGAGQVVGFFRSHTRPGLYLDQDDFAVFSRHFPDASQVFLLVRPSPEGPAMGGFFFWEDGDMNRRTPYRQFPFDCERLAAGGFPITAVQPAAPGPRLAPVAVPKPAAPAARAPRQAPPVPWMVVPVIAGLFLMGALFLSKDDALKQQAAAALKASPPVETLEPLLQQPKPQPATPQPAPHPLAMDMPATPKAPPPQPPPARPRMPAIPAPSPVKAPRTPLRTLDPPPVLANPVEMTQPALAALLRPRVSAAPPPAVEVSYEQPHAGVFRRAFHKIAPEGFVPPSPIRKVAPAGSAGAGDVDVKVFIDESGSVARAQVLTKGSDQAAASLDAAREWQFTPARKHDKPVPSEMLLHFRF